MPMNIDSTPGLFLVGFLLTAGALLPGCAPLTKADCDPAIEQDAITKMRCMQLYEQRSEELQLTLAEQRALHADLKKALEAAQKEAQQTTAELQQKQQDYTQLNKAVQALLSRVKSQAAQNERLQQSIRSIEAQLAAVNETQSSPSTLAKRAELDELQRRLVALQQQLGQAAP